GELVVIEPRRGAFEQMAARRPDLLPVTIVQRFGSWLFDGLMVCVCVGLPAFLATWWFGPGSLQQCDFVDGVEECSGLTPEALRFTRTAFWIFAAIFFVAYTRLTTMGRSLGKRATESEVVDGDTGEHIGWGRAAFRTLVAVLGTAAFGVTLLWVFTNSERRTLHDLVANTRVISP
ncbi:MAG: RDD family protein, partial [Actinomycetota bacterium]